MYGIDDAGVYHPPSRTTYERFIAPATAAYRARELDPEDAPKEHRHEWFDGDVRVVGWSRESGASKPDKPVRLFASHDDGMVVLEDVAVTSNTQTARPIKDGLCNRLSLTRDECRWLLHRLPEVLAAAEQDPR